MPSRSLGPKLKAAFGELLIIILGVLIALWAENWRQGLDERSQEQQYIERLLRDLDADLAAIDLLMAQTSDRAYQAKVVLDAIDKGRRDVPASDFLGAVEYAWFFGYPSISRSTFNDLMSTGNLRLLRSSAVKDGLSGYYSRIDGNLQFRDLYVPTQQRLGEVVAEVLDLDTRYTLFDGLPADYEPRLPWPADESLTEEAADRAMSRLLENQEARTLFAAMARTQGRHHANLAGVRADAEALIDLIEEETASR